MDNIFPNSLLNAYNLKGWNISMIMFEKSTALFYVNSYFQQ